MSSSRVLTATSGTCASIRLPSPTIAWSRVPSRMRAQPVRCSRPGAFVDGKDWIGSHSTMLSPPGRSVETRITTGACQRRSFSIFTAQASSRHLIGWLRCTTLLHDTAHLPPGLTPIVGRSSVVLDYWSVVIVEPKIRLTGLLGFELFRTNMRHSNPKKTNTGRIW